ncbi:MAG: amidohydrolase family protein [Phycisphaeraceae bacterium]
MEIIDAYTHCGLDKYEPIERVRAVMQAAGVSRAVLVQHLGQYDNSYLERVVATDPEHLAAACLVDHQAPDAAGTLAVLAGSGRFRGVRLTTQVLDEAPALFELAADLGLVIVLYAPKGMAGAVEPLERFLDRRPAARIVITHLGNPAGIGGDKHRGLFRLAAHGGTFLQISGMGMFCPYPHEPLYELVAEAFDHFGPNRLCWGSNYPVVGGQNEYRSDLDLLLSGRLPLPAAAIPAIAGANARQLWFE